MENIWKIKLLNDNNDSLPQMILYSYFSNKLEIYETFPLNISLYKVVKNLNT